jgi:hypothetical protein
VVGAATPAERVGSKTGPRANLKGRLESAKKVEAIPVPDRGFDPSFRGDRCLALPLEIQCVLALDEYMTDTDRNGRPKCLVPPVVASLQVSVLDVGSFSGLYREERIDDQVIGEDRIWPARIDLPKHLL